MSERGGPTLGRVVLGLLLVVVGIGWLLQSTGVVDFPLRALLPLALVVVGAALLWRSRTGSHPGLILLGLLLVAVLSAGEVVFPDDARGVGGIGERLVRPDRWTEVDDGYRLDAGELVVDLSALPPARSDRTVSVEVGVGEVLVLVPRGMDVGGTAEAGLGEVVAFGREEGGVGVDVDLSPGPGDVAPRPERFGTVTLELSVGVGRIEVSSVAGERSDGRRERVRPPIRDGVRRG